MSGHLPQNQGSSWNPTQFLTRLEGTLSSAEISLETRQLKDQRIQSISHATEIIKRSREGRLASDLEQFSNALGGIQSAALWNAYFRTYDKIVTYSNGYIELLTAAEKMTPKAGVVLDIGTGTGNFSAALLFASHQRSAFAVDISHEGLNTARDKIQTLIGNESRFEARQQNLRMPLRLTNMSFDGAVMNNVLYAIPPKDRPRVLKQIFSALKPGATFFLNDPAPHVNAKDSSSKGEAFLTRVVADAILNGSPMTEIDLAFFVHVNRAMLLKENPYLSASELSDIALEAGFQIFDRKKAYYDATTALSLRRPVIASRPHSHKPGTRDAQSGQAPSTNRFSTTR